MRYQLIRRSYSIPLIDVRVHSGSRLFASLPMSVHWYSVRNHVGKLKGADLTDYLSDGITEVWIEFRYCNYRFTINNQLDEYWLFVDDPGCPDLILYEVAEHFSAILGK